MSNKIIGNHFEQQFCERLFENGFWVHNLAQNSAGQPADVIAVRNGNAYLIDCKVCSTEKGFSLNRIEDNQSLSMELWEKVGNNSCYFALLYDEEIYMITFAELRANKKSSLNPDDIKSCMTLDEWLKKLWERGE